MSIVKKISMPLFAVLLMYYGRRRAFYSIFPRVTQKATSPENKTGGLSHRFRIKDNLDCPAARGDNHGADVQLAPLTGDRATNHQRREADHDAGHDVTGQHDKYRSDRPDIASTKSAKSIFATLLNISRPTYISAGAVA